MPDPQDGCQISGSMVLIIENEMRFMRSSWRSCFLSAIPILSMVCALCVGEPRPARAEAPKSDLKSVPGSAEFLKQAVQDSEGQNWKPLFNGKNLDGWKVVLSNAAAGEDPEKIFQVADGMVHVYRDIPAGKKMPFGVILSDQAYSNYRFRFDFKWGEKKFAPRTNAVRDAGLLFHVVGPEKVWPMSVECQVQEHDVGDNYLVYTGGDVPVDAAGKKFQDAADGGNWKAFYSKGKITRVVKSRTPEHDGWNTVEVIVRGDSAIYLVNGEINNYIVNLRAPIGPDGEVVPLTSGKLALQCEWAELFYRNIELLELKPQATPPAAFASPQKTLSPPEDALAGESPEESIAPIPPRSPQAGLASWKVRDGFRVELVAAEPLVLDPVAIDWGNDGKLWVVEMADYPLGMDGNGKSGGRVRFLQKSQPGGAYDRSTLFLEGLNFPTGIVSWGKGVIVTAAPEIFYAEDTDGDGKCDLRKVLFTGFHEGNQQLRVNGLRWGLDGWIYCASGSHVVGYGSGSKIHSELTGKTIAVGSRDFRFQPVTGELEPLSGPAQFGRNPDDRGNWFGVQNSFPLWHYVLEDQYLRRNPYLIAPDARELLSESNPRVFPAAEIGAQPNPYTRVGRFTSACSGMVYQDQILPLGPGDEHALTCEPVHNLVQHNVLTRSGPTFTMRRDVDNEKTDFLASTDPWCRPVMIRTGPDGALWVVDMYRYIIEHPQWVPADVQKEMAPFLRLGDRRGRIYRIVPEKGDTRTPIDIAAQSLPELVQLLDHPNGFVRSAAQRQIAAGHHPSAARQVRAFYLQARTVPGKLYASYLLNQLGHCTGEHILAMLQDSEADVRRHALILAEQLAPPGDDVFRQLALLVNDPSESVRLQLALSVGEWDHPTARQILVALWNRAPENRFQETALFSSLNQKNIAEIVAIAVAAPLKSEAQRNRYQRLVAQAIGWKETGPLLAVLQNGIGTGEALVRTMITLNGVYSNPAGAATIQKLSPALLDEVHQASRKLLDEGSKSELWQKELAVSLLFLRPGDAGKDRAIVEELLSATSPSAIQNSVIRQLGTQRDPELGKMVFVGWKNYLPTTRDTVLEVLAARPAWHPLLLDAIDTGVIQPATIPLSVQDRLLRSKSSKVTSQLKARFQQHAATSEDTARWIEQVRQLNGDLQRGEQVFKKHCSDCHQFRGAGFQVGPNLSSMTGRTAATLMDAVVSPNKAVEPKYISYSIALNDGRIFSGIIDQQADNSITLVKARAEKNSVLQSEIETLSSTGKSLMPEGFDRTIPPQEMADLLLYLQQN